MGEFIKIIFYELGFWFVIGAITLRFLVRYISKEDFTDDELEDTTTWD